MRGGDVESVEEWEKFIDIMMECTNYECGLRRVGGRRIKGSVLWNEEVDMAVAENIITFHKLSEEL